MFIFIIATASITAIVLWLLVRPLLKTKDSISYERQAQNIHYARERLSELESQLKNATISATDYEALKLEIEQTLADDINLQKQLIDQPESPQKRSSKQLIILLCLLLPISAVGLYFLTGTPIALDSSKLVKQTPMMPEKLTPENIQQMLQKVEQQVAANPSDTKALSLLSQIYHNTGRYQLAITATQKLLQHQGESADLLARLADATALLNQGDLTGDAAGYLQHGLQLNPKHPQILWMSGLAAIQQRDAVSARQHWNTLLPLLADNPSQQQELKAIIQQTQQTLPNKEQPAPENKQNAIELDIKVTLANELRNQVDQDDIVFVFAKAQQGPPAPLAVKRLTVADLPASVSLTEADAMIPQFTIATFDDITVSARVAKSGNPTAQPGDLQSSSINVQKHTQTDTLLHIDSIIE